MANPEHLAKLKLTLGLRRWSHWRTENQTTIPDLSGADLRWAELSGADLGGADLSRTDLTGANLAGANLAGANLARACLKGTNLDIMFFTEGLALSEADAFRVDNTGAYLHEANIFRTDLRDADLKDADLRGAILIEAKLDSADLRRANLKNANLSKASLKGAKLLETDLRSAKLQFATLDGASLTGARLWETQRAGWSIKDVLCERAFWDRQGTDATIYSPREFEKLYSEQTRIELFYEGGITTFELNTLPALLHHLTMLHPDAGIRFRSVEQAAGGARVVITVVDSHAATVEMIRAEARRAQGAQTALRDDLLVQLEISKGLNAYWEKLIPRILVDASRTGDEPRSVTEASHTTNIYGRVINLAQHSEHVTQSASIGIQSKDLRRLVAELTEHFDDLAVRLGEPERNELKTQIEILKSQVAVELDPEIVKQTGRTLRNIIEGAVGSLIAAAAEPSVWQWVSQVIQKFN